MASEFVAGEGVVYCVWGKPAKADVDLVVEHLRAESKKSASPVVYITRVPADAPAPDAQVRTYLNSLMPTITSFCSTYHVVLEGSGFTAAMKRGVLVSLFQISKRRSMFFVHSSTAEVSTKVAPEKQVAVHRMLRRAEAAGLLSGPTPTAETAKNGPQRVVPPPAS
jgi:hypothetical protein